MKAHAAAVPCNGGVPEFNVVPTQLLKGNQSVPCPRWPAVCGRSLDMMGAAPPLREVG